MDSSATSPKKAKKAAAPKKPAAHPAYKDMIAEAIRNLKERNGSSRQKIAKYLQSNYNGLGDESALKRNLKASLKKLVSSGSLIQTKGVGASGSFKLPAAAKKPAAVKKPVAAKKVAKKPASAKKAAAKKTASSAKKSPAKKKASTTKKASGANKSPKKPKAKVARSLKWLLVRKHWLLVRANPKRLPVPARRQQSHRLGRKRRLENQRSKR